MSGIQSILALGAVWLFALISINFNSTVVHNLSIEVENKVYLTAFSLADDKIEKIKQKAFDECTVNNINVIAPSSLTNPLELGPETGEDSTSFDDIDDYNGDSTRVGLPYVESFDILTKVIYADSTNFDNINYQQKSFYKRVSVKVKSIYLTNPVELTFIFSLHSKLR